MLKKHQAPQNRSVLQRIFFSTLLICTVSALISWQQSALAEEMKEAPQFSLPSAGGNISLTNYAGKVVLLDFWASWCGPCRQSFPWMNDIQEKYQKQGLEIIAINLDQEPELAAAFLQDIPARFTVAYDTSGKSAENYGVMGMPSAYLIDREGKIHSQHIGFHQNNRDAYEKELSTLLAQ